MTPAPENALARLSRLLTMVPWLHQRQGIELEEAARGLGVTPEQLTADLELLFVCGYGQLPDELIEAEWEQGRVYLGNVDTIARPLRLGVDEAVSLIVALRTLLEVSGSGEFDAAQRALAKLEAAAQDRAVEAARVEVSVDRADPTVMTALRRAVSQHRRLRMSYLVPGRDEATLRDVDPLRIVGSEGHWYLEGWCHRAHDMRTFRVDRIETAEVLSLDGTPPEQARPRDLDAGIFQASPGDELVTLRLSPAARWVGDYYPVESCTDLPEGGRRIVLATGDTRWLVRLIVRLGGQAVIESPPELAAQVADSARQGLAQYAP